jgi:hypothetical protein
MTGHHIRNLYCGAIPQKSRWAHWEAVKRIFRYLKGTRELSSVYRGKKEDLQGWVDTDGASQEHRRAITGYVFMVDSVRDPKARQTISAMYNPRTDGNDQGGDPISPPCLYILHR